MVQRPNMSANNWNFLKLLKTIIVVLCGSVWVSCASGYFVFRNRMKNYHGVTVSVVSFKILAYRLAEGSINR